MGDKFKKADADLKDRIDSVEDQVKQQKSAEVETYFEEYSLAGRPDAALEAKADEVIALLARAQGPDGYLNTYYTLVEPQGRWANLLEGHELYCAGHLIEAAVAYHAATQKPALLGVACRFADLLCSRFGPGEAQSHGYAGHPEIELALIRLADTTGNTAYYNLARYFVQVRGGKPNYFTREMAQPGFRHVPGFEDFGRLDMRYNQSHMPLARQTTAEGHAVRAVYLYCAMADIAAAEGDAALLAQCRAIWSNIVHRRMYVTGGIGSSGHWERFTADYDLPGDYAYSETCASIGLALFGLRMARATREASYMDVVERALYNVVRAGISLEGDRYFYVNPLAVWPPSCMEGTSKTFVKPQRQKWFDTACCPTNVARTLTALGQYIYSCSEDSLYVNLFVQNTTTVIMGGKTVSVALETGFPRSGHVRLLVRGKGARFTLYLRMPGYARQAALRLNGEPVHPPCENGYWAICRTWNEDEVDYSFELTPRVVYGSSRAPALAGKAALLRGPEVYCLEEADNGAELAALVLDASAGIQEEWREGLLGGVTALRCRGYRLRTEGDASTTARPPVMEPAELMAVPYGLWGNRSPGEMLVWMNMQWQKTE